MFEILKISAMANKFLSLHNSGWTDSIRIEIELSVNLCGWPWGFVYFSGSILHSKRVWISGNKMVKAQNFRTFKQPNKNPLLLLLLHEQLIYYSSIFLVFSVDLVNQFPFYIVIQKKTLKWFQTTFVLRFENLYSAKYIPN